MIKSYNSTVGLSAIRMISILDISRQIQNNERQLSPAGRTASLHTKRNEIYMTHAYFNTSLFGNMAFMIVLFTLKFNQRRTRDFPDGEIFGHFSRELREIEKIGLDACIPKGVPTPGGSVIRSVGLVPLEYIVTLENRGGWGEIEFQVSQCIPVGPI